MFSDGSSNLISKRDLVFWSKQGGEICSLNYRNTLLFMLSCKIFPFDCFTLRWSLIDSQYFKGKQKFCSKIYIHRTGTCGLKTLFKKGPPSQSPSCHSSSHSSSLHFISLNHKGAYCVMLRSSKGLDTCKACLHRRFLSRQNCIKFQTCSKPLRYRGDKSHWKSHLVYTCDFEVAPLTRQKLHRVAATKIARVNGP